MPKCIDVQTPSELGVSFISPGVVTWLVLILSAPDKSFFPCFLSCSLSRCKSSFSFLAAISAASSSVGLRAQIRRLLLYQHVKIPWK
jgi:hypothetical protein